MAQPFWKSTGGGSPLLAKASLPSQLPPLGGGLAVTLFWRAAY